MKILTPEKRKKILEKELKRILNLIIQKYKPLKVILFGSMIKGKIHEWSDIDLIIIKKTKKRAIDRCIELAKITKPKVGIDFFAFTPSEIETLEKENNLFIKNALKKGKVLYEKRN